MRKENILDLFKIHIYYESGYWLYLVIKYDNITVFVNNL